MNVGIIGYGVVGKAVASAYDEVMIYDPKYPEFIWTINDLTKKCDVIFICVPTPTTSDGACDTRILVGVLDQLIGFSGLIVCKSTATPNFYSRIEQTYGSLKLAHVPEFLSPDTAEDDYLFPVKIVIGTSVENRMDVFHTIMTDKINYDYTKIQYCSITEAAMFNYLAKTMLDIRSKMALEYSVLSESLGVNWNNVVKIAKSDTRLGEGGWNKSEISSDTIALASLAKFMNVDMSILNAAIAKNGLIRG